MIYKLLTPEEVQVGDTYLAPANIATVDMTHLVAESGASVVPHTVKRVDTKGFWYSRPPSRDSYQPFDDTIRGVLVKDLDGQLELRVGKHFLEMLEKAESIRH